VDALWLLGHRKISSPGVIKFKPSYGAIIAQLLFIIASRRRLTAVIIAWGYPLLNKDLVLTSSELVEC